MKTYQERIRDMIRDEYKAPKDYLKIRKLAKTKKDKQVINSIIRDEKKHFIKLNKIIKKF